MKKIIVLLFLAPLLMATQCDEDGEQTIFPNNYKVKITNQNNYNINDTVWIEGRISSKVYNSTLNDSVFSEYIHGNQISIYKFVLPNQNFNTKDAIDKFELIHTNQSINFLGICNNSTLTISPILNSTGNLYNYKLGLRIMESGDYIIHFNDNIIIENTERNLNLISNYPMPNSPYLIGLNSCGNITSASDISERFFCFKIN